MKSKYDLSKWEKNINKFFLNKEKLSFKAQAVLTDDGKIRFLLEGLDPKYEKATRELMLSVSQGAVYYMNYFIRPDYIISPEDKNFEQQKCNSTIETCINLIPKLFENSEAFFSTINQKYEMLKLQYLLTKITYVDGKWRINDSVWEKNGWVDSNGIFSTDSLCTVWTDLLN